MEDLILEIQKKTRDLDKSIKELRKSGTAYAEAEAAYKMILRTEALKLRDSGMPVGLMTVVVYGIDEVAKARQQRDIAEAIYKANQEAIQAIKLMIRILDSQIQREWHSE